MESRLVNQMRKPIFLGFFSHSLNVSSNNPVIRKIIKKSTPKFVPVSNEGKDLKNGKWNSFDDSLSFLDQPFHFQIVGSSNGFLLCCTDYTKNMNYIICNPITRGFHIIPEPHKRHFLVALAFICKGELDYSIYRIRSGSPTTTLEMEIFSSKTGEWKEISLVVPTSIMLPGAIGETLVFEDVIYWKTLSYAMMTYNPASELVEVIKLPERNFISWSDCLGHSEGKIHYSRNTLLEIEVWVLEEDIGTSDQWTMKHRAMVEEILRENPHVNPSPKYSLGVLHFHPHDHLILVCFNTKAYWYNYQSGTLSAIEGYGLFESPSFIYECPGALFPVTNE